MNSQSLHVARSLIHAPGTTWQACLFPSSLCQLHDKAYPNLAYLYMKILIQNAAKWGTLQIYEKELCKLDNQWDHRDGIWNNFNFRFKTHFSCNLNMETRGTYLFSLLVCFPQLQKLCLVLLINLYPAFLLWWDTMMDRHLSHYKVMWTQVLRNFCCEGLSVDLHMVLCP